MRPFALYAALVLTGLSTAGACIAAEGAEASVTLHSTITGNQEQPKVLYIVPWQPPGGVDQLQQPVQSLLGDVFAPTDRAEFRRELKYRAEAAAVRDEAAAH
jgi:hypothetical protein